MENLSPKSIWIFFVRFLLAGLAIFIFFLWIWIPAILAGGILLGGLAGVFLAPIVFLFFYVLFCYGWAKLTYKNWLYEIAEDTFKMEQGVIWKRYVSIPYERIQNVDIHRGVIARIIGLSDLRIQTAGFGGSQGRWGAWSEGNLPGIEREKAEQLREEVVSRVKGKKQGL
jgi:membrane protein YdbS with pleckstrin-like domain